MSPDILPEQLGKGRGINFNKTTFPSLLLVHTAYHYIRDQNPWIYQEIESYLYANMLDAAVKTCGYKLDKVLRIKFNLQQPHPRNKRKFHNVPHVDNTNDKHYSLIFYPENTDGDTVLFNQMMENVGQTKPKLTVAKRVSPIANRCVMFNGWRYHAGSNPSKYDRRIVMNCNFTIKE